MKLASNLNRTDIELLKQSLLQENDGEQLDYFYWIGSTSHFDTQKLHQQKPRNRRRAPSTIFRWYDSGETAQLDWIFPMFGVHKKNIRVSLMNYVLV